MPAVEDFHDAPRLVTVACANFTPVIADRAATLERVLDVIRDARRQGAQLVAFPEQTFGAVGYCPVCADSAHACDTHVSEAEPVPGPTTEAIAAVCAELDVHVVVGIDELDPATGAVHNAAALIAPDGIGGTFRKLHLGHPSETCRYTPGAALPVWQTALGPIGVLVCYDFWSNPELSRILALKGARILVNVTRSATGPGKDDYVRDTTVVRAQENLIYAMSANWAGPAGDGTVGSGNSTIAGPAFPAFNHVLATAGAGDETIVATLNFDQLDRWYDLFPWAAWRRDPERQLDVSRLIADEFAALADGPTGTPETTR